jgi:copper transport protein
LINSWNLLGSPRDLFTTDYGRLMLVIAAVNKFYFAAAAGTRPIRCLQRNGLAEILLGLCVLGFVGALGTLSPTAHPHATSEDRTPDAAFVHIHAPEAMAEVTITPGRAGASRRRFA